MYEEDKENAQDVLVLSDPLAPKWNLQDFDVGRKLGEGQFGAVYLARERRSQYIVALKSISKHHLLVTCNEHLLRREIEIHSRLFHPHILGFYGWFTTESHICLILEIAPKGELMDLLSEGGLEEPLVSKYVMQMISAIQTCHRLNVMHRDLKPENILVDMDGNLKLADFGWAAHVPAEESNPNNSPANDEARKKTVTRPMEVKDEYKYLKQRRKTYCGTLDYLSPEICRNEWYGKEVDLWCIGILCYELSVGSPPFNYENYLHQGYSELEARKFQQRDIQNSSIKFSDKMSPELKDFLNKTLDKNPLNRINTQQMMAHPFITKYNKVPTASQPARAPKGGSSNPSSTKANLSDAPDTFRPRVDGGVAPGYRDGYSGSGRTAHGYLSSGRPGMLEGRQYGTGCLENGSVLSRYLGDRGADARSFGFGEAEMQVKVNGVFDKASNQPMIIQTPNPSNLQPPTDIMPPRCWLSSRLYMSAASSPKPVMSPPVLATPEVGTTPINMLYTERIPQNARSCHAKLPKSQ